MRRKYLKRKSAKRRHSPIKLFKKLLLKEQKKLQKMIKREKVEIEVGDELDLAEHNLEKDISFYFADTERKLLSEVENALFKIQRKEYGTCENCKKEIPIKRLKAIPWTRYCVQCQKKLETEIETESLPPTSPEIG